MSPLEIKMMLHFYAIGEPYKGPEAGSEAFNDAVAWFEESDLITDAQHGYQTTERGDAFVRALCETPLPIKKWVMPGKAA